MSLLTPSRLKRTQLGHVRRSMALPALGGAASGVEACAGGQQGPGNRGAEGGDVVAILLVSLVGGAIGGGIIAYLAYRMRGNRYVWRERQEEEGGALLESFSLDLWRLYVSVVSGGEVPAHQLAAASERGLFLVARLRAKADIEQAVFGMLGVLGRARERAREQGRIGLRVTHSQFADLSEQIAADFALLQLEAERLGSEIAYDGAVSIPGSLGGFLRRHGSGPVRRLRTHKDRRAGQ